jgi:DNA polymerase
MNEDLNELILDVREQLRFLHELGVEEINADLRALLRLPDQPKPEAAVTPRTVPPTGVLPTIAPQPAPKAGRMRLSDLPSLVNRANVIPVSQKPEQSSNEPIETEVPSKTVSAGAESCLSEPVETIEQIRAEIGKDCNRCKLCSLGRKQVVNSVGNFSADLMFVGEAPGADEDQQGEPFVGRAGQLLTDIIEKGLQIPREEVFIGNMNRCRPPMNRAPEPDETAACKPFLLREIAVIRPRVIVVLGATAAHNLLEVKTPISKLRGNFVDYQGVKVMPTFHPAYLLRDPHKKREVWEDIKKVRDYLNGVAS